MTQNRYEVVEDKGEPVYVNGQFYEEADDAATAVWDDGGDPTEAVAHPCTVGKAHTPDVVEHVLETWSEQYEDPDAVDLVLSDKASALAHELQLLLQDEAPSCWTPRTRERVLLPARKAD